MLAPLPAPSAARSHHRARQLGGGPGRRQLQPPAGVRLAGRHAAHLGLQVAGAAGRGGAGRGRHSPGAAPRQRAGRRGTGRPGDKDVRRRGGAASEALQGPRRQGDRAGHQRGLQVGGRAACCGGLLWRPAVAACCSGLLWRRVGRHAWRCLAAALPCRQPLAPASGAPPGATSPALPGGPSCRRRRRRRCHHHHHHHHPC
jgi:hypothetical protein